MTVAEHAQEMDEKDLGSLSESDRKMLTNIEDDEQQKEAEKPVSTQVKE